MRKWCPVYSEVSDQFFSTDPLDLNHREFESVYLKSDAEQGRGGGRGETSCGDIFGRANHKPILVLNWYAPKKHETDPCTRIQATQAKCQFQSLPPPSLSLSLSFPFFVYNTFPCLFWMLASSKSKLKSLASLMNRSGQPVVMTHRL